MSYQQRNDEWTIGSAEVLTTDPHVAHSTVPGRAKKNRIYSLVFAMRVQALRRRFARRIARDEVKAVGLDYADLSAVGRVF